MASKPAQRVEPAVAQAQAQRASDDALVRVLLDLLV
jgi:hypothetical protein